jgi:hypothetical protein
MANVFTPFATAQNSASSDASAAPNLRLNGGNLHLIQIPITAYTAATADPLYIYRLPKGARIIPQLCQVDYGDPGDALTGSIGLFTTDATPVVIDVDAFGSALALGNAAGRKAFSEAGTKGDNFLTPLSLSQDSWLVATWTTATVPVPHAQNWTIAYTLG